MELELSDEQKLVQKTAADFARTMTRAERYRRPTPAA